jgi:hypothetical protein
LVQRGIMAAFVVTITWIVLQNLLMFARPAENRFRAMLLGYLLSVPFVYVAYRWFVQLPFPAGSPSATESPRLGWIHAYFFHLLLFFFYVECFYHVERSVTLRLLVELLKRGPAGAPISGLQGSYPVEGMIHQRLGVLRERGFVEQHDGAWHLSFKGQVLARVTNAISWFYQSQGQHERN